MELLSGMHYTEKLNTKLCRVILGQVQPHPCYHKLELWYMIQLERHQKVE